MRRGPGKVLLTLLVGAALTGCVAGRSRTLPVFGDGTSLPKEFTRTALPVWPGPDGDWVLNSPDTALLGQGRTVTRLGSEDATGGEIKGWRTVLPDEFALTSYQPGDPHSAFTSSGVTILVGGRAGHDGPTAVAGLDMAGGGIAWRHELPPGTVVSLLPDGPVAATCTHQSCQLTEWDDHFSGKRLWSRTVPGPLRAVSDCEPADSFPARFDTGPCQLYLVSKHRVGAVVPPSGPTKRSADGVQWVPSLRPPAGAVAQVFPEDDRTILVTAPAKTSCRASVVGSGVTSGDGDDGWRYDFVWDQPQAARDPVTGCRWDPAISLDVGNSMVLPDKKGALIVSPYFGTLQEHTTLAPGEYLVTDTGDRDEIVRAQGHPDRLLYPSYPEDPGPQVPPGHLGPDAREVVGRFWQEGRSLILFDLAGKPLWRTTSDCRAFPGPSNAVDYCDGKELVEVRPESGKD